jgi:two-component system, chemotaxis family, chemotaxis protein CheY
MRARAKKRTTRTHIYARDTPLIVTADRLLLLAAEMMSTTYIPTGNLAAVPPADVARPHLLAARVDCKEVSGMGIKALVTDSSREARKNIIRSLREIGIRDVVEAVDGQQAVQLLETGKFDICFAEWNTQVGQGEELVQSFRCSNAKMPVIVTAPQSKRIEELKKSYPTASNYLTLPFTNEQLQKTVAQYVPSIAG